jgi:heme-degrading monooxygenase HmoA
VKNAVIVGLIALFSFGCAATATQSAATSTRTAVAREWKGRVAPARADEYHVHLIEGVKKMRAIAGYLGVEVMRRDEQDAVAFTVISYWESRDSIKAYAGDDIEKPRHLPIDKEMLLELPTRVLHYDVTYTDLGGVRLRD